MVESRATAVVVTAIDQSDNRDHILDVALAEAEALGASLLAVHCIPNLEALASSYVSGGTSAETLHAEMTQRGQELLQELQQNRFANSEVPTRAELCFGDPWSEIIGLAVSHQATRIVLGAHDQAGDKVENRVFGSTTERVLRQAPCPVLVVPTE